MILLLISFMALGLQAPNTPNKPQLEYIDLDKSHLVIVKIPSGTFWMGTNPVLTSDGGLDQ
jgi:hypothetical protein